mgnify:FL=1
MNNIGKHVYFVGIGGIGMSALARILLGFNIRVSGSDVKNSPLVESLREDGAQIFIGHNGKQIPADVDLFVYTSAIKGDNPEYLQARERGIKIISRAELLAMIMAERTSIAIAGAHGKTSTTGMIGTMLAYNHLDPTIVIGGMLPNIGGNACWGNGEYLVAEADESDGSFLILNPKMVVVTNVENDHLDYYGTMEKLAEAFHKFIKQVPENGFVVLGTDNAILSGFAEVADKPYITYGLKNPNADYTVKNINYQGFGTVTDIYFKDQFLGKLRLSVPGEYNISNALAGVAVGRALGLSFTEIADGLAAFAGTGRRFEQLGHNKKDDIVVVDDYAHHPTEIKAVLHGAKNLPFKRVIGVFQPHRYSRTNMLQKEFAEAFSDADIVIINEIYSAFEAPIAGVSAKLIIDNMLLLEPNKKVYYGATENDILKLLDEIVQPNDLVMIMGAGNIRHTGELYAQSLANK